VATFVSGSTGGGREPIDTVGLYQKRRFGLTLGGPMSVCRGEKKGNWDLGTTPNT